LPIANIPLGRLGKSLGHRGRPVEDAANLVADQNVGVVRRDDVFLDRNAIIRGMPLGQARAVGVLPTRPLA